LYVVNERELYAILFTREKLFFYKVKFSAYVLPEEMDRLQ